jgi:hypothetical protein
VLRLLLRTAKKTPIAAYVDTGAQVTVISASAARRAGILHLMDRRYAGRATGVGHCKVLGRIPARHVYFFLGGECHDGDDEGGGDEVEMDGPALTVLEGTVTQGVDVLLGLDVLQDWEAEIRMGAQKSITVKKRRTKSSSSGDKGGGGKSGNNLVVIPFVRGGRKVSASVRSQERKEERYPSDDVVHSKSSIGRHSKPMHYSSAPRPTSRMNKTVPKKTSLPRSYAQHHHQHHSHHHHQQQQQQQHHLHHRSRPPSALEDEDFSPTASDIESDLDMLEQSSHETDEEESETLPQRLDDGLLSSSLGDDEDEESDDDDFLQDVEDEDADDVHFDMSGL